MKLDEAKNFSPYLYAEGDPVNDADPSGLMVMGRRISDGDGDTYTSRSIAPRWEASHPFADNLTPGVSVAYQRYTQPLAKIFQPSPVARPQQASTLTNYETIGIFAGIFIGGAICLGTAGVGCVVAGGLIGTFLATAGHVADRGGKIDEETFAYAGSSLAMSLFPVCRPGICKFLGKGGSAAATGAAKGWKTGNPIDALTKAGNVPAWSTVRGRYWKNVADEAIDGEYSPSNLSRMIKGRAPLDDQFGASMELNHIVPRHKGGGNNIENLEELWPWKHAAKDEFRFYTGPRP